MRIFFLMISVFLLLVACDNPHAITESTLGRSELTERERALLTTAASQSFVYDFSVEEEYKNINIWVDRYEFGKLKTDHPNGVTMGLDEHKGMIIFSTNRVIGHEDQIAFRIGVYSDQSTAVGEYTETMPTDYEKNLVSGWGDNISGKEAFIPNMVLGSMNYSSAGNGTLFHNELQLDEDLFQEVLKEYDVSFIFRVNFTK
ncbi:hypothetical protein [Robertmurraya korlensis]|uniref:hypothetical protein n=1 Tax=Robertmurraya korlensis TaxID=519977 RepID=UPI0008242835|nr:hypothetical protein [Robertmurraya korlensis]